MPFPNIRILPRITESISYVNVTGGSYNNSGQWIPGTSDTITFLGTILPLTDKDLEFDLGGTYTRNDYKLYTTEEFNVTQRITHNSINYEIQSKDDRLSFANYRRYIIRRVEDVNE